jgi:integrase
MAGKQGHRGFGYVRKLPSKRFQASYLGPDGLRHLAGKTFNALLFPATTDPTRHLQAPRVFVYFSRARRAAGRPDLRFHDLRHTGAVFATRAGASLAEVMARLGHSTTNAAMRYQHAAKGRDAEIADALSRLTEIRLPGGPKDVDVDVGEGDVP